MTGEIAKTDGARTIAYAPAPTGPISAEVSEHPGGWHLVTHGSFQLSVGPDAQITLPRHLTDAQAVDFCRAVMVAAHVAADKRASLPPEAAKGPT